MRTEPDDLDRADLAAALAAGRGLTGAELEYVPEGGGSHHWSCVAGGERRVLGPATGAGSPSSSPACMGPPTAYRPAWPR